MIWFLGGLGTFLFGVSGQMRPDLLPVQNAVFGIACAVMGVVAVVFDWVLYSLKGQSVFALTYGESGRKALRLLFLWGVGAGIGGFLGIASNMLQPNRLAAIGVGVGWPLLLPRLIESFSRSLGAPEPVQPSTTPEP